MKLFLATIFLAAVSTALPSKEVERSTSFNTTVLACNALKLAYSAQVFFPGDANYTTENECEFSYMKLDAAVPDTQLQIFGLPPITSPQLVFSHRNPQSTSRARSSFSRG